MSSAAHDDGQNLSIDDKRNARKLAVVVVMTRGEPTYVTTIEPPHS